MRDCRSALDSCAARRACAASAPDCTAIAEALFSFVEETIETELPNEIRFLQHYDTARRLMHSPTHHERIDRVRFHLERLVDSLARFDVISGKVCDDRGVRQTDARERVEIERKQS